MAHAHRIKAPMLLLVGLKDKRVPASQAVELYYQLQRRGATTQLLAFPDDGHPLDKPVTEAECWLHIVAWMDRWVGLAAGSGGGR